MRIVRSILIAFCVVQLHAATMSVRVIPAAPTNLTPVVVEVWGEGGDPSDVPYQPVISMSGTKIQVDLDREYGGNISVTKPYGETIQLGQLAPGDYEVRVTYHNGFRPSNRTVAFQVRDVVTLRFIDPVAADPGSQGLYSVGIPWVFARYEGDNRRLMYAAWIGDVPARIDGAAWNNSLRLTANGRLAPGLYDVTVQWDDGTKTVARNAVLLQSPQNDGLFGERFLVPVVYNGADATGAQWESVLEGHSTVDRPAGFFFASRHSPLPTREKFFASAAPHRTELNRIGCVSRSCERASFIADSH